MLATYSASLGLLSIDQLAITPNDRHNLFIVGDCDNFCRAIRERESYTVYYPYGIKISIDMLKKVETIVDESMKVNVEILVSLSTGVILYRRYYSDNKHLFDTTIQDKETLLSKAITIRKNTGSLVVIHEGMLYFMDQSYRISYATLVNLNKFTVKNSQLSFSDKELLTPEVSALLDGCFVQEYGINNVYPASGYMYGIANNNLPDFIGVVDDNKKLENLIQRFTDHIAVDNVSDTKGHEVEIAILDKNENFSDKVMGDKPRYTIHYSWVSELRKNSFLSNDIYIINDAFALKDDTNNPMGIEKMIILHSNEAHIKVSAQSISLAGFTAITDSFFKTYINYVEDVLTNMYHIKLACVYVDYDTIEIICDADDYDEIEDD